MKTLIVSLFILFSFTANAQKHDTAQVWFICALKYKTSSLFSVPGLIINGKEYIRRRPGKYVPLPKNYIVLQTIKKPNNEH